MIAQPRPHNRPDKEPKGAEEAVTAYHVAVGVRYGKNRIGRDRARRDYEGKLRG